MGWDVGCSDSARWEIDVLWLDVDMVEKILVHEVPVGFDVVFWETCVFVEVKAGDSREGKAVLLVETDEFVVIGDRCAASGEPEDRLLPRSIVGADKFCCFSCELGDSCLARLKYFYWNLLHVLCVLIDLGSNNKVE